MQTSLHERASRRGILGWGLAMAMLGLAGCGDTGTGTAPPQAPGGTGTRARLDKFKENAEKAIQKPGRTRRS